MRMKLTDVLAGILGLCLSLSAQTDDRVLQKLDDQFRRMMSDWECPGLAVAIVKDDAVIFAKGYGVRELGKPELVDENTLFAVGSQTKAFTAARQGIGAASFCPQSGLIGPKRPQLNSGRWRRPRLRVLFRSLWNDSPGRMTARPMDPPAWFLRTVSWSFD